MRKKKQMIFFMMTLSLNLFVLFFLNYRAIGNHQTILANGLYNNWAITLSSELLNLEEYLSGSRRFFMEHIDNGNVRTVIQAPGWEPPLTSGSFFNHEHRQPVAVVGSKVNLTEDAYFLFEGIEFEVIGILGEQFPTRLDYLVLLNDVGQDFPITQIVMDADSPYELTLLDINSRPLFSQVELMEFATQIGIGRDIFEEMMWLNTMAVASLFLMISVHSFFILSKKNDETKYYLGFTLKEIYLNNHLLMSRNFLLSLMIVFVVNIFLKEPVYLKSWGWFVTIFFLQQFLYMGVYLLNLLKRRWHHGL